ncbi:3-hydroxyacyl-CoA dehydrogenase NAD-binding domain-containing protein [Dactylosporangium sp. NPDC051484]|uniref:3-hydroxyacyl-CoA dehydrogenase NAD-binding domain-containing protein n=1 Tax=Dactylosporangium sp. NPDC051484 TaxID=3154942 RepID=UPI00344F2CF2
MCRLTLRRIASPSRVATPRGSGIAQLPVTVGYDVVLTGQSPARFERVGAARRASLGRLAGKSRLTAEAAEHARVRICAGRGEAVQRAAVVVEAGDLDLG